jgi:hypothetical protein
MPHKEIKVFWFFSSEKNVLSYLARISSVAQLASTSSRNDRSEKAVFGAGMAELGPVSQ